MIKPIYVRSFNVHYAHVLNHIMFMLMTSYGSTGRMLELIDELIISYDLFKIL